MNPSSIADWLASLPDEKLKADYPLFFEFRTALARGKKKGTKDTEVPKGDSNA